MTYEAVIKDVFWKARCLPLYIFDLIAAAELAQLWIVVLSRMKIVMQIL